MDSIGTYRISEFPRSRLAILDTLEAGARVRHVAALLEFDVTDARSRIHERKRTGEDLSFTAWLVSVVGRAVSEHKPLNSYRQGRSKVIEFDDVDVSILVERDLGGVPQPIPYVVRQANRKSAAAITREIRDTQAAPLPDGKLVIGDSQVPNGLTAAWLYLPEPVRGLFWRYLRRNGKLAKRVMGTVVVSSLGMFGRFPGWPIPIGVHTLELAIGGAYRRPAEVDGQVATREFLRVTAMVDHALVDGAPAARFIARLADLLESAWGLD